MRVRQQRRDRGGRPLHHDGTRVLFAESKNGFANANVDGSGKVVVKESDTAALVPAIQSLTW